MGCYCREISIMSDDIGTIGSCISNLIKIKTVSEEIFNDVVQAADNLNNSIDITNKESVVSALKDLCKDESSDIDKVAQEWKSFKESLENRLEEMRRSDSDYHEAQRRKHEHKDSNK